MLNKLNAEQELDKTIGMVMLEKYLALNCNLNKLKFCGYPGSGKLI